MVCDYCEIVRKKTDAEIIYEDDKAVGIIKEIAASPGQICLMPKDHYAILELVPDSLLAHLFKIANKLSMAVFSSLGIQGTNLIIQNGTAAGQQVPHFCIEIIPRKEGDSLNFQWKTKQLLEEEMDTAYLILKEEGDRLVINSQKEEKKMIVKENNTKRLEKKEGEENYLLKQLDRVP